MLLRTAGRGSRSAGDMGLTNVLPPNSAFGYDGTARLRSKPAIQQPDGRRVHERHDSVDPYGFGAFGDGAKPEDVSGEGIGERHEQEHNQPSEDRRDSCHDPRYYRRRWPRAVAATAACCRLPSGLVAAAVSTGSDDRRNRRTWAAPTAQSETGPHVRIRLCLALGQCRCPANAVEDQPDGSFDLA